ncbi:MAG: GNAT family N-acetyltransferase [Gammaproteobacteria bacterium]
MAPIAVGEATAFSALPVAARALLEANVTRNPFVCATWLQAFEAELLGPGETPLYLWAEAGGEVLAVLPLLASRRRPCGVLRLRAMGNFYTGLFDAAEQPGLGASPARRAAVAAALAAHLATRHGRVPLLEMQPLRDDDALPAWVAAALAARGYATRRYPAHGNWYEDVAGIDFATYMQRRPGQLRSTLERKRRRLLREHDVRLEVHDRADTVAAAFSAYETVYVASWKSAERSPAFIRRVMSALAAHGIVNLGVLTVDGMPAAAQLWVRIGRTWAVFKLAYDPRFADYSVGTILTAHVIEGFFAAGAFDALDFLSGDDAYKRDWMAERRQHWGSEAISPRSLIGQALRLKRRLGGTGDDA